MVEKFEPPGRVHRVGRGVRIGVLIAILHVAWVITDEAGRAAIAALVVVPLARQLPDLDVEGSKDFGRFEQNLLNVLSGLVWRLIVIGGDVVFAVKVEVQLCWPAVWVCSTMFLLNIIK